MLRHLLLISMLSMFITPKAQVFGDVLNMVQRQGLLNKVKKINVFYHLTSERGTSRYLLNAIEFTADGYALSGYTDCSYIGYDRYARQIKRRPDGKITFDYITPLANEKTDTLFLHLFIYDQVGHLSKVYDLQYGRLAEVTYDALGRPSESCTYSFIEPSSYYKPGQRFYGDYSYKRAVIKINNAHLAAGRQQIDSLMAYTWSYTKHSFVYKKHNVNVYEEEKIFEEPARKTLLKKLPDSLLKLSDYIGFDGLQSGVPWELGHTWGTSETCGRVIGENDVPEKNQCFVRLNRDRLISEYVTFHQAHGLENAIVRSKTRITVSYDANKLPDDLLVTETELETNESRVTGYYTFEYDYFK